MDPMLTHFAMHAHRAGVAAHCHRGITKSAALLAMTREGVVLAGVRLQPQPAAREPSQQCELRLSPTVGMRWPSASGQL
jgi:hypothetical protein